MFVSLGLQAHIREAWSKEQEVEKGIKSLTYIERLKERVKKVKIPELRRAPCSSPDLVPERKRTMPTNPAKFFQRLSRTVSQRPIRDRVIHLLALKNYKKPELLSHLEREGVVQKDKESLGKILQEVANLDANENSFSLKEHFFKDIQEDWPGYTERDRQTLEVTLSQKPTPSQNSTSTSQSPSLGPSEGDTPPRTAQKRPLDSDFLSPVMGKKQRIDQEPSDVQPAAGGHSPSFLDLPSTSCSILNMSPSVRSISVSTEVQLKNKVLTHSGFPVSARVQGKTPKSKGEEAEVRGAQQNNPGPVPEKKRMVPMRLADIDWSSCAAVYSRPYRDRVIHLLALRDYKEPELLARLQRDGVRPKDKDSLGKILQQVANVNAKENSFSLKEHLFQTLQSDWPGYSKIERKSLKSILSRKSAPSQNPTSSSQATSPRPSETDAPARPAQIRPWASGFISPVRSKKQRTEQ
ncbi:RNA polymerase II elongation factor ELL2-like isoform X2 [Passer domesticus]|uniref:RNA polymerase II elongation factor ELL2-like isoform X2 n=2 Tax=Passer domesticus TaxID=48849 RepID=UPI0030FF00B6